MADYKHALRHRKTDNSPRLRGRALQARRLRIWVSDPCCARCGRVTRYPDGFELDHVIPLCKDGPDTDDNCQVLCIRVDEDGRTTGCHEHKTADDMGYKPKVQIGLDGWPVE